MNKISSKNRLISFAEILCFVITFSSSNVVTAVPTTCDADYCKKICDSGSYVPTQPCCLGGHESTCGKYEHLIDAWIYK